MNVTSLNLGLVYVKKGKYKYNPIERAFTAYLVLIPIFIYALYENWIIVEIVCWVILTINCVLLFRYMLFGVKVKVKECSCTYEANYLAVKALHTNIVSTYSDIEKVEYNEKSGILYVYCKRDSRPVVIAFSVWNDNDIKSFSKMTGCVISMI